MSISMLEMKPITGLVSYITDSLRAKRLRLCSGLSFISREIGRRYGGIAVYMNGNAIFFY